MSKQTFILLNEKTAWVGSGQVGNRPEVSSWESIQIPSEVGMEALAHSLLDLINSGKHAKRNAVLILSPQYFENRPFQVPPVGPAEMPAIINMLAKTQLSQATEDSIVDFVSMPVSSSQPNQQAFVSATSSNTNRLLHALKTKGVSFSRILPRIVAGDLLRAANDNQRRFTITVLPTEIDMAVTTGEQLLMVRTSVLPVDPTIREKTLRRETARSAAVLAAEFGSLENTRCFVSGEPSDTAVVADSLADQAVECEILQPDGFGEFKADVPSSESSMGLVAIAALKDDRTALLDFANPAKPPKEGTSVRTYALAGAAVVTAFGCLVGLAWWSLNNLDQQQAKLAQEIEVLEVAEPGNKAIVSKLKVVNDFVAEDSDSLQLLDYLSQRLPFGDKMRVKSLNINGTNRGVKRASDLGIALPVTIVSLVSDKEMTNEYRPVFQAKENWELNSTPSFAPVTKSAYYAQQVTDIVTITPDFEEMFSRLEDAYFVGANKVQAGDGDSEAAASDAKDEEFVASDLDDADSTEAATESVETTGTAGTAGTAGTSDEGDAVEPVVDQESEAKDSTAEEVGAEKPPASDGDSKPKSDDQ